ncbi:MAG: hypothetical protein WBM17_15380 [Anaerolineales bacterium]
MKWFSRCAIVFLAVLAASCSINTGGSNGGSGGLVADPASGLDALNHYRASLTKSIAAETADGPVERTDRLSLAVWRKEKAVFETVNVEDGEGGSSEISLGRVDKAGYVLLGGDTACQVFWDEDNVQIDEAAMSAYLYPLKSGSAAGEETVAGIAAHVYDLNSDSLGVDGVKASGKAWLAAKGGYILKYHLELEGSDALFGKGANGTLTLDYELSEVNSEDPVAYPGDCQPVLTDIPAMDDARDVQRLPAGLYYATSSTPDQAQSFYKKYFSAQGWEETWEYNLKDGRRETRFLLESTGRTALVALQTKGQDTMVEVDTNDVKPPASTPSADSTPEGEPPGTRIMSSLMKLLGSAETPGALPSYAMVLDLEWPASSGKIVTHLEAEVEGLNNHYVHTSGGKTTDALLFGGKEYEIVGGKAQAGSIGLRTDWILWQTDWLKVLMAAGLANPKAEPGTTLEGRAVEVYSVDGTNLPDMTGGILPVQITAMRGTIWVDQATGALLKADLTFDADVKKSGQTEPAHDTGKFLLVVSRIGQVKVNMP